MHKRVLIITYYWPPSGGITVLRMLKFSKYLRQNGWEPVIFTADGAGYPTLDPGNERDVPAGAEVIRQPIWEPYDWYKKVMGKKQDENVVNVLATETEDGGWKHRLAIWVRSNFFIPDARAFWIAGSVKKLTAYLQENPVDAMISTGPPHSNNRIATLVKKQTGLPWIANFQDPWTQVDYFSSLPLTAWARRRHERMERELLDLADLKVIVSPSWREDLRRLNPGRVEVITNGFDPEDFAQLRRQPQGKFSVSHIGIMGFDRYAEEFFDAIVELNAELPGFRDNFRLNLRGEVDYRILAAIREKGLEAQTDYQGAVARAKALQLILDSQLLLLLQNQADNAKGRIPGKLFEYLAVRRPVLNFGPTDGDVARILDQANAGVTFTYAGNKDRVKALLGSHYDKFLAGEDTTVPGENINQYAYPELTKRLAGYLDEVTK